MAIFGGAAATLRALSFILFLGLACAFVARLTWECWLKSLDSEVRSSTAKAVQELRSRTVGKNDSNDGSTTSPDVSSFQNIATSLVFAYCGQHGSALFKAQINSELKKVALFSFDSLDNNQQNLPLELMELDFGTSIPSVTVVSHTAPEPGQLHLGLKLHWQPVGAKIVMRAWWSLASAAVDVAFTSCDVDADLWTTAKSPYEVRYECLAPVLHGLKYTTVLIGGISVPTFGIGKILKAAVSIGTRGFLTGAYAHNFAEGAYCLLHTVLIVVV